MPYTGTDYFLRVQTSGATSAKVRDYDLNEKMDAKGNLLYASGNASDGLALLDSLTIGSTGQILAVAANGLPEWANASAAAGVGDGALLVNGATLFTANQNAGSSLTIANGSTNGAISIQINDETPSDVFVEGLEDTAFISLQNLVSYLTTTENFATTGDINDAALDLKINSVVDTGWFSANTANRATLTIEEGATNGTIKVNRLDVPVHGLGTAAFAATTDFDPAGSAASALTAAQTYADSLISGLGSIMVIKGVTNTVPSSTTGNEIGDVYIINGGDNAGEEYVWNGTSWELFGSVNADGSAFIGENSVSDGHVALFDGTDGQLKDGGELGELAFANSVVVPENTFATGISATANSQTITYVSSASSVSNWNGGSAEFVVDQGVLSLSFTAATASIVPASTNTSTINTNTYSIVMNSTTTLDPLTD